MDRTRRALIGACCLLLPALAACGGGSGDPVAGTVPATVTVTVTAAATVTAPPATTAVTDDEAAIRDVARRYLDAVLREDADEACALMNADAQAQAVQQVQAAGAGNDCAGAIRHQAQTLRGSLGEDIALSLADVTVVGDSAKGDLTLTGTRSRSGPTTMTFERVDGAWLVGPGAG